MPLTTSIPPDGLKPYGNLSGKSGVTFYGVFGEGEDVIVVVFEDGSAYAYAERFIGTNVMDDMKALAEQGQGLATYIAQHRPNGMKIHLVFGI